MKSAQEQLAEIELAKIKKEEVKRLRERKLSKKVMKYGCLPLASLFIIIIIIYNLTKSNDTKVYEENYTIEDVVISHTGNVFNPKVDVNNFCTMTIKALIKKYGKPKISSYKKEKDYTWVLNEEKGLKVMVFTDKNGNQEVVRFFNLKIRMFPVDFGWDANHEQTYMDESLGTITIQGLQGIKKARYDYKTEFRQFEFNIELSGQYANFGKLQ